MLRPLAARLALAVALVLAAPSAASGEGAHPGEASLKVAAPVAETEPGEPALLAIWGREVVTLRARVRGLEPAERVARAKRRIAALPYAELLEPVRAEPARVGAVEGLALTQGATVLLWLVPDDLDPESGRTLAAVGRETAEQIQGALAARAEQRRLPVLIRGTAAVALATLLVGGFLRLVVATRRALLSRLELQARGGAPRGRLRIDLLPYVVSVVRIAVRGAAVVAVALSGYLWLTFVLVQFPYSEPWGFRLGAFLFGLAATLASGAIGAVPGLVTVVVIFLLTRSVANGVGSLFRAIEYGRLSVGWLDAETAKATRRLVIALVWVFAATVAYPYIPGSSTEAFKGIGVLVGLMVSLGSTGFVNQLMSGLVILYSRTLRAGEYVRVGETEGVVREIGVLSTKLATPWREEVTIPNAVLVNTAVTNHTRLAAGQGVLAATTVTIGYDAPWRQVHALLERAAQATDGVRGSPPPRVWQRALSDFYVEYQLLVHLERAEERIAVLGRLHAAIQDSFNEAGVQILSPHFALQPPGRVTVPKDAWHAPPAEPPEVGA